MTTKKLDPVHPGEILQKEFLEPMGLSQNRLALALGVPARRINEIVLGKRGITADTALRLARYFKISPQFWLGLQMDYELDVAEDMLEGRLEKEVTPMFSTGQKRSPGVSL
ncbi:MAG: HigA family addiction module antitoxin [Thermodesulfobacteriota bacterium]|nr:HigA family addiction module antitoxin [Thermodesulfobacteriota bacterium]